MAVARQLDVQAARVVRLAQGSENRVEIDLALSERDVIVNRSPHVLDVNVPQYVAVSQNVRAHRKLVLTLQMADVQRQPEKRVSDTLEQLVVASHRVDEHPRLRLE